jgi:hypothetical protein
MREHHTSGSDQPSRSRVGLEPIREKPYNGRKGAAGAFGRGRLSVAWGARTYGRVPPARWGPVAPVSGRRGAGATDTGVAPLYAFMTVAAAINVEPSAPSTRKIKILHAGRVGGR